MASAATKKPLSLLCWMGMNEDMPSSELLDVLDKIFTSQDEAITAYIENDPTAPRLTSHRGLFLFQQDEDKSILLGSGQWPSSAVCQDWFGNEFPAKLLAELEPLYRADVFEVVLMEDLIFPEAPADDSAALSNTSRLEIFRWRVAVDKKGEFEAAAKAFEAKQRENDQSTTFGAWRLDDWPPRPDSDTVKEYIVVTNVGGSDASLPSSPEEALCEELAVSVEKKHFTKAV
jgi:hypothetical protein